MQKAIERIKNLISSLPNKDAKLGYKFLKNRDFDSLQELVDSAIYLVKKNMRSENPKEEYKDINLEDISKLKSEVDTYIVQLELPKEIYEDCNDLNEDLEIEEEEYY